MMTVLIKTLLGTTGQVASYYFQLNVQIIDFSRLK